MRSWMWAGLAASVVMAGGSAVSADDDTVRLGGPSVVQGGADTELVRGGGGHGGGGHGGGGHGGGFHGGGYHGGYYGGGFYGRGYYGGGYRGYYGGYYRPYYYGYGWPYYGGLYGVGGYGYGGYGYGGYGYGLGTGGYGYISPSYYYPYNYCSPSYYPIAGESVALPVTTVQGNYQSPQRYVPPMPPADGIYPYDGGPRSPVPMPTQPGADPSRGLIPVDGKLVSLPTGRATVPATPRVTYPAYGDEPLPPAPRKTNR